MNVETPTIPKARALPDADADALLNRRSIESAIRTMDRAMAEVQRAREQLTDAQCNLSAVRAQISALLK